MASHENPGHPSFVSTMTGPSMSVDSKDSSFSWGTKGVDSRGGRPQAHSFAKPYPNVFIPPPTPTTRLQSVVTTSFSVDAEERAENSAGRAREFFSADQRTDSDERRDSRGESREGWDAKTSSKPPTYYPPAFTPPRREHAHPSIQRAYSSGYYSPGDAMKRSYFHHSVPSNQHPGALPPDFMPPSKRSKIETPRGREIILSPRNSDWQHHPERPNSFIHRANSYPMPPTWSEAPYPPSPYPRSPAGHQAGYPPTFPKQYSQVSPASDNGESPRAWQSEHHWSPQPSNAPQFWNSPRNRDIKHKNSYTDQRHPVRREVTPRTVQNDRMRLMVEAAASAREEIPSNYSSDQFMLLALPQDRAALSETLCVVRENIEIFSATQADVDAPAPGRKNSIHVGQVGLRCIHCRHTTKSSDRVKRAVCYPSSIKRIYRTVIDMKLDHFPQCKFVPADLKHKLNELKAVHTRSTGTTMQYFIHAAHSLGMEDGPSGVFFRRDTNPQDSTLPVTFSRRPQHCLPVVPKMGPKAEVSRCDSLSSGSWASTGSPAREPSTEENEGTSGSVESMLPFDKKYEGTITLALPEDKNSLSPLRCFLRENVCAFSATENDIAVRAPTTFSITVGQVGIGCVHCVKQPPNLRSNRAVCFPFSIARVYQSVADIQRFHFGECKNMPPQIKEEFLSLQSASSKGSKGLATRQYWVASAKKIGLVDTPQGIRFGRDPNKPEVREGFSLDILAQAAFSVTTQSKQLVMPEDKSCIAEFLYVVMEQLQPCRFTEADRNKRRLKDVGCIGVECKHCAGQVDSRKFFWSSVSAVESNFVSVHTHMLECKSVPPELKERLLELKKLRKEQTAALRTGSQKAFFARVWQRLHDDAVEEADLEQQLIKKTEVVSI